MMTLKEIEELMEKIVDKKLIDMLKSQGLKKEKTMYSFAVSHQLTSEQEEEFTKMIKKYDQELLLAAAVKECLPVTA